MTDSLDAEWKHTPVKSAVKVATTIVIRSTVVCPARALRIAPVSSQRSSLGHSRRCFWIPFPSPAGRCRGAPKLAQAPHHVSSPQPCRDPGLPCAWGHLFLRQATRARRSTLTASRNFVPQPRASLQRPLRAWPWWSQEITISPPDQTVLQRTQKTTLSDVCVTGISARLISFAHTTSPFLTECKAQPPLLTTSPDVDTTSWPRRAIFEEYPRAPYSRHQSIHMGNGSDDSFHVQQQLGARAQAATAKQRPRATYSASPSCSSHAPARCGPSEKGCAHQGHRKQVIVRRQNVPFTCWNHHSIWPHRHCLLPHARIVSVVQTKCGPRRLVTQEQLLHRVSVDSETGECRMHSRHPEMIVARLNVPRSFADNTEHNRQVTR